MSWPLIAALGSLAWLSVAFFFTMLCRASGRADEFAQARVRSRRLGHRDPSSMTANDRPGAEIFDIRALRVARASRAMRVGPR
jgi:hypothetical protein